MRMDELEKADKQRTPEWYSKKLGKLSASRMSAAMNFLKKGGESSERYNLKFEILSERLTGEACVKFKNDAMRHGIETEPVAKIVLRSLGFEIEDVGFIDHPIIKNFGASPDGFMGNIGLIEIKCPTTQTHLEWILAGVIPEEHKPQMLAQLACTGRAWCEFVSFDDRIEDPEMRVFNRRYCPQFSDIKTVEQYAIAFLSDVEALHKELKDAYLK